MNCGRVFRRLASVVVLGVFVFLAFGSTDTGSSGGGGGGTRASKPSKPKTPAAPAPAGGTASRVEYEVKKALGTSNRKVTRVSKVQTAGQTIHVHFSINDNLTEGFIKTGAKMNVERILKAIQRSGYDYSEVTAIGTFSMQDKFGNSSEDKVLQATYKRSTVDRINWDGFLTDNIYSIADGVWLHPAFLR